MSPYINQVTLLGDLLDEPRLRFFADGSANLRAVLETRCVHPDVVTGEMIEEKQRHDIVMYGVLATSLAGGAIKGDKVWVRGVLQSRSFCDWLTGRCGTVQEILVQEMALMPLAAIRTRSDLSPA